jgi:hypothetical protein
MSKTKMIGGVCLVSVLQRGGKMMVRLEKFWFFGELVFRCCLVYAFDL